MKNKAIESSTKLNCKVSSHLNSALKLSLDVKHPRISVKEKSKTIASANIEDLVQQILEEDTLTIKSIKEWKAFFKRMSDLFGDFTEEPEDDKQFNENDKCL